VMLHFHRHEYVTDDEGWSTGERIRVPIPWIKVLTPILGVLWVVGVYFALKHLPDSVQHWFYVHARCVRVPEDEEHPLHCNGASYLGTFIWIGLSVAPFVAVHYFRKWRRELEERVRRDEREREWRERELRDLDQGDREGGA
jgi:hypothetical protein